jgi:hypothetical protein
MPNGHSLRFKMLAEMYRQFWNEVTVEQKADKEAGEAFAKHTEEHGC